MISLGGIGSYIIGIFLLIIVLKILTFPLKIIFKFVYQIIVFYVKIVIN